jgi:putative methyltransferase (TIGR04325 family)
LIYKVKYFIWKRLQKTKAFFSGEDNSEQKEGWFGDYATWNDVIKQSTSYNEDEIFNKVDKGLSEVINGNAAFERDSIAFKELIYSDNLLLVFKDIAEHSNNSLSVVDFGGSLGSIYFQYRTLLSDIKLNWSVVEQGKFVEIGQKKYSNKELKFYHTIDEALSQKSHDVLLLSSVLAYLEEPESFLKQIVAFKFKYIILYRTAFVNRKSHLLTIQHVPSDIYKASYPSWFFNEEKIVSILSENYSIEKSFDGDIETTLTVGKNECYWKCLVFKLK